MERFLLFDIRELACGSSRDQLLVLIGEGSGGFHPRARTVTTEAADVGSSPDGAEATAAS
jgi:hypothetical protein